MATKIKDIFIRFQYVLKNPTRETVKNVQYFINRHESLEEFTAIIDEYPMKRVISNKHEFHDYLKEYREQKSHEEFMNRLRWIVNMRKAIKDLNLEYVYGGKLTDHEANLIDARVLEDGHSCMSFNTTFRHAAELQKMGLELWAFTQGIDISTLPHDYKMHMNPKQVEKQLQ